MTNKLDMRKGSTTVLILSLLDEGPMYGYQLAKELAARSGGIFDFKEGTPYGIITMDIMMPDLNGIDALKEIRQMEEERDIPLGRGAKIIMVTVKTTSQDVISSFREGCEAYVVKPFDKDKIEDAMRRLGVIE